MGVEVDLREFKQKIITCKCKHENKTKIQAEVDVSIAVKMLIFGFKPETETITLFAGDRDFIDAINFVNNRLRKPVTVVAFQDNLASRIMKSKSNVLILNRSLISLIT
jgi:uncharacterized LabA/DUF88 family protein